MVENPVPPSMDFFSSKRRLIKVLFPAPLLPNKRTLIKTAIFISSSIFIKTSSHFEFLKENISPNSLY